MSAQRFELTTWECMSLLGQRAVGRICIIEHGYPLAIPMSYAVVADESRIVIRTSPGTMLGRYEGLGSFEVDDVDLGSGAAWSVIVRGTIRRVTASYDLPDPGPLLDEGRTEWITLEISAISGRRFVVRTAEDGFSVAWQLSPT